MNIKYLTIITAVLLMWCASCRYLSGSGHNRPELYEWESKIDSVEELNSNFETVLSNYVNSAGLVDYGGLKADRNLIESSAAAFSGFEPSIFKNFSEEQKIAFWINAYNALTLFVIVENYPIEASLQRSLIYPKNSIRQISGVWDELRFEIMGRQLTLNDIEHEILRKDFSEPRIHMALVCAAKSCPPLRQEPYVGERLDEQLSDQSRRFFGSAGRFRVDENSGKVFLSKILDWFSVDFEKKYKTKERFLAFNDRETAVLNFAYQYIPERYKRPISEIKSISYLDYDWSLNEQ